MNQYAFTNADGTVVNVIVGNLTPDQQQLFLRDQATLFGATQVIEVEPDTSVWIGGSYTAGEFLPPAEPEPQLEAEPAPELQEQV